MSESFEIRSSARVYQVEIGTGLMAALQHTDAILVADGGLAAQWPFLGGDAVISVSAREEDKTLGAVGDVIEAMRGRGANRDSHLSAVGGGIVQDVATFAASAYMRGIAWTYYPTTLLGMVDSCIGGKSSINVGQYKNIAGNYHPPEHVVIDTDFIRSLPPVQRVAGLCEAAKICFASRDHAFERYLELVDQPDIFETQAIAHIIALSLRTKKRFIEEDEFDQGIRLLLNFGHTFGHALEGASGFAISHGVAVGLGILAARHYSIENGLVDARVPRLAALTRHLHELLGQVSGLGESLSQIDSATALTKFKSDKKHKKGEYALIVIGTEGFLERRFVPATANAEAHITRAFDSIKGIFK